MKRPLVIIIISFILGIIFMNIKRTIFYMVLFFFCVFLISNKKCLKKYNSKYPITDINLKRRKIIIIIMAVTIAFSLGYFYVNVNYNSKIDYISDIEGEEVFLSGIVIEKEENEYLLKKVYINGEKICGKIKVRSNEIYEILDELSAKVVLELPKPNMNFGGFDYREYLFSKNIIAIGEELDKQNGIGIKLNVIESSSIRIREYIADKIDASYPCDEAQILKAILLGKSNTLEEDIRDFYQKAGIIHILVVSGSHVVLIIVSLKLLLDKLKISKQYYSFVLIFLIIVYIYITGCGESILRAGIVSIIVLIANILGRQNDTVTTIFLSAFILILINPMVIYNVGLQLSFAGALGIVLLSKRINIFLKFLPQSIVNAISVGLAAQLFVMPITAYHFNNINLIGMISTLVVTPIIDLIMPLGFVGVLPLIDKIVTKANYFLITLLFSDAKFFSYLNIFNMTVTTPSLFNIVFYYLLVILCFVKFKYKRKIMISVVILFVGSFISTDIKPHDLEINFLYVGHGDSIFISTPSGKTILIDTGDNYLYKDKEYNMAERTVVPFILDKGYKNIDLMILSHLDSDHAAGVETIFEKLNVKQVFVGKNSSGSKRFEEIKLLSKDKGIKINLISAGNSFEIDGVNFNVLAPFEELNESENNNSIVLMIEYKSKKVLLMGDMESAGEELLVKRYNLDADILKVGHHGSITSTTDKFVNEVTPNVSIISLGERFKSLPNKEVLERLNRSKVYKTNIDGGIKVVVDMEGKIKINTSIEKNKK